MITTLPELFKVKRLEKSGNLIERDKLVAKKVKQWAQKMFKKAHGSIQVMGAEQLPPDKAVVFISNHQSNFDILVILGYIDKPAAFISKIEVLKLPIIRSWMRLMQCVFMNRKDLRQSAHAMQEGVEVLKRGYSMVIFPEGTRSKGKPIGDFKAGSFKLPLRAGVQIVPVTIQGTWHMLEEKGRIQPAQITLIIHEPIPTNTLSQEEISALPEKVKHIIAAGLAT